MRFRTILRRAPKIVCNALHDLRYGVPLGGTIHSRFPHLGAHDVANSDYGHLRLLFAEADVTPDDVIVDVGCGKGRAINWFLSHYPRNTIYGIELDLDVCARTSKRLRRFSNVNIVWGDATKLLPEDGTVFYLYNPFDQLAMRQFISALVSTNTTSRQRRIAYNCCQCLDLFLGDSRFDVKTVDIPVRYGAALIRLK
jgi:SAM-dependent methyltransferase